MYTYFVRRLIGIGILMGIGIMVTVVDLWMVPVQAQDLKRAPYIDRGHHTAHLVRINLPRDQHFAEALDGIATSLKDGHDTVILFDGSSVALLRMHIHREKKTLLHDTGIAEQERQAIAKRLGVALADAPRNYFEYAQLLAKAGVKVFANRDSMRQLGLAEDEIHPIARLISTRQVSEILDRSDFCDTVGTP